MQNPKAKKDSRCLFSLSEYARAKAACKMFVKSTPAILRRNLWQQEKLGYNRTFITTKTLILLRKKNSFYKFLGDVLLLFCYISSK